MDHRVERWLARRLRSEASWRSLTPGGLLRGPARPDLDPRLDRPGRSVNQRCRLMAAADGWVAVQLARDVDIESVPAVIMADVWSAPAVGGVGEDPDRAAWTALKRFARTRPATLVADRCRLLGLPAAALGEWGEEAAVVVTPAGPVRPAGPPAGPVVDLSALWAGPLAAMLVGLALDRPVVDVESSRRVDPMRIAGDPLARLLHERRTLVLFDHRTVEGLAVLADQVAAASLVVTSGRPRALSSLGLDPFRWAAATGGVWVHVSGYGLGGSRGEAAAFGDDAAVAGGLVAEADSERPRFVADAVADPLSGVEAAHHALAAVRRGGGAVVDVAMAGVAAAVARSGRRR